jgi:hypothetical protein
MWEFSPRCSAAGKQAGFIPSPLARNAQNLKTRGVNFLKIMGLNSYIDEQKKKRDGE